MIKNITNSIKPKQIIHFSLYYIWLIILTYNYLVRVPEFDKIPPCGASYLRAGLFFWTIVITIIYLIVIMGMNFYFNRKMLNNFQYIFIPLAIVFIIINVFQFII